MNTPISLSKGLVLAATLVFPMVVWADNDDNNKGPANVVVQFGQNRFPQDAAPLNHFLDPNDVTIGRDGTVTFEFNGGGHGIAIYQVSKKTTRRDIEEDLCQPSPAACNPQGTATSNLQYLITDAKGHLIIDTGTNPPNNRVDDPEGRLIYVGAGNFLTGRNPLATPPVAASVVQFRFEHGGRYLVTCINRGHLLNDRMFGFVNVAGDDDD